MIRGESVLSTLGIQLDCCNPPDHEDSQKMLRRLSLRRFCMWAEESLKKASELGLQGDARLKYAATVWKYENSLAMKEVEKENAQALALKEHALVLALAAKDIEMKEQEKVHAVALALAAKDIEKATELAELKRSYEVRALVHAHNNVLATISQRYVRETSFSSEASTMYGTHVPFLVI